MFETLVANREKRLLFNVCCRVTMGLSSFINSSNICLKIVNYFHSIFKMRRIKVKIGEKLSVVGPCFFLQTLCSFFSLLLIED